MKMLKNLGLAMVALSLLAIPAPADHGKKGLRNNNGTSTGKQRGQDRAEEVQGTNKKGDRDPTKGSESKAKRKGWGKKAEHNAKGHS